MSAPTEVYETKQPIKHSAGDLASVIQTTDDITTKCLEQCYAMGIAIDDLTITLTYSTYEVLAICTIEENDG